MRIETYPVRTFCCEGHEGLTGYAGSVKVGSDGAIAGVHSGRFIRDTPGVLHLAMHHSMRFGSNQERIEICPTDNFRGLTPPNVTTHAFDFDRWETCDADIAHFPDLVRNPKAHSFLK